MIENITKMYSSRFKIICPLTSGRDSRVVYAFLKKVNGQVDSYTIWKDSFKKDSQDWDVPVALAKLNNAHHEQIYRETVTDEMKREMDEILGVNGYPEDAFVLSVTVNKHYGDSATMEGDIIGQVGKCSLHRDIPSVLATPAYFRCKLHNYSNGAKKFLKSWLKEIKQAGEQVNTFDLFSIENRLGVWASHTHLIRNVMGQMYVNIFNSRSIIYVLTAVDRAKRMKSEVHIELIKKAAPELLEVPFEQEKSGLLTPQNPMQLYFTVRLSQNITCRNKSFSKTDDTKTPCCTVRTAGCSLLFFCSLLYGVFQQCGALAHEIKGEVATAVMPSPIIL